MPTRSQGRQRGTQVTPGGEGEARAQAEEWGRGQGQMESSFSSSRESLANWWPCSLDWAGLSDTLRENVLRREQGKGLDYWREPEDEPE